MGAPDPVVIFMALKGKGQELRQNILDAANRLFYERGFHQTSFSDIAEASGVPRGNFYYYFKSKDEILEAVVAGRLEQIRGMLAQWEAEIPEPRDRLRRYVQILLNEERDVMRYGCPMGSLNMELGKTRPELLVHSREMFLLFRDWLQRQFRALGAGRGARDLALHLLACTQGTALVASSLSDPGLLRREAQRLKQWIDALPTSNG